MMWFSSAPKNSRTALMALRCERARSRTLMAQSREAIRVRVAPRTLFPPRDSNSAPSVWAQSAEQRLGFTLGHICSHSVSSRSEHTSPTTLARSHSLGPLRQQRGPTHFGTGAYLQQHRWELHERTSAAVSHLQTICASSACAFLQADAERKVPDGSPRGCSQVCHRAWTQLASSLPAMAAELGHLLRFAPRRQSPI